MKPHKFEMLGFTEFNPTYMVDQTMIMAKILRILPGKEVMAMRLISK